MVVFIAVSTTATLTASVIAAGVTVVAIAGIATAVVVTEASKETAETNAEAQKHTADQARIAQVEAATKQADAEKHGYNIDKDTEGMILARDEQEFEKELASEKEIDAAQWALLQTYYTPETAEFSAINEEYDYGFEGVDASYDSDGDVILG
ncbi:MAG: hypothetical protein HYU97_01980 [Deltaproteobacteria bacterium]|nr:hypothetical protein [Deltaproteobacteria bacterium]